MMYANASVEITMGEKHNDLTEIIAQALNEMKREKGSYHCRDFLPLTACIKCIFNNKNRFHKILVVNNYFFK